MEKIIFYQPIEKSDALDSQSGTVIRPRELKKAFVDSGYEVFDINGNIKHRIKEASLILKEHNINYIYVESANIPMSISNRKHWKVGLLSDIRIFYKASKKMKIGIFYRDAHWRYKNFLSSVGIFKGCLLKILFYIEYICIKKVFDYIFVPSMEFCQLLPRVKGKAIYAPLPPGIDEFCKDRFSFSKEGLNFLYSGNVSNGGTYDIEGLIEMILSAKDLKLKLTINTPHNSWEKYRNSNLYEKNDNIIVSHYTYDEMLYKVDIGTYNAAIIYLSLPQKEHLAAMPIKLFQYIGLGLPIIGCGESAYNEFIIKHDIGWVIDSWSELDELVNYLKNNPIELEKKHKNVVKVKIENSWKERVGEIEKLLGENN